MPLDFGLQSEFDFDAPIAHGNGHGDGMGHRADRADRQDNGHRDRERAGLMAYHAGHSAEEQVIDHYIAQDYRLLEQRWRGKSGEIDLIFERHEEVIFVEVKMARRLDWAAERISARQISRIIGAATEFVGYLATGQLTPMRFDLALVDLSGTVRTLENAFWDS